MSKRIIVVEDEAIIAAEIKSTVRLLGYSVVGHASNGDLALDLFASIEADLILLDINIKGSLSGIDLAKVIREKYDVPFIFLTSFSDELTLNEVKKTNPYGYIVKPFGENDLKVAIELALYKYGSEIESKALSKPYIEQKLQVSLTQREYDMLISFKEGLTYVDIGKKLFISVNTVKTYQKRLFQLFNVSSRHGLVEKLR